MLKNSTIIDIFTKAKELVTIGWCQWELSKEEEGKVSYCALGALRHVTMTLQDDPNCQMITTGYHLLFYEHATSILFNKANNLPYSDKLQDSHLVDWNNDPNRTQAEVVEAFNRAIELVSE